MPKRVLEPHVELTLYDAEHVLVRVTMRTRGADEELELVLEDAAWRELSRRRVTLRCEELVARLNPPNVGGDVAGA